MGTSLDNPSFTAFSHYLDMKDQGVATTPEEVESLLDLLVSDGALVSSLVKGLKIYHLNLDV